MLVAAFPCHLNDMFSVESVLSGSWLGEHSFDLNDPLHVTRNKEGTFGAFLDEFTGADWTPPSARDKRPASPYADENYDDRRREHSTLFASDASVKGIVNGMVSTSQTPTAESDILRKPSTDSSEAPESSSLDSGGEKASPDVPVTPKASLVHTTLAFSSVRALSNTTYLRRMHLSKNDAVALFPEIKKTIELVFSSDAKRYTSPGHFKTGIAVSLYDRKGRRWPVVLECLRTAGQRHVRLNKGWIQMCSANGIAVGKRVRLARWEQVSSSRKALVTVSVE